MNDKGKAGSTFLKVINSPVGYGCGCAIAALGKL